MHLRSTAFTAFVFTTFAAATECYTGNIQCCVRIGTLQDSDVTALLGLLNIAPSSVGGPIGITCSPISVVGVAGSGCMGTPVCCENNSFGGIIALGCTPVNIL